MAKIIVFEHTDYRGDALVLTESISTLKGSGGFDDAIGSCIVVEGSWTLYKHKDYDGSSYAVIDSGGPDGDGCYPSYKDWGGDNNEISSIKLNSQ